MPSRKQNKQNKRKQPEPNNTPHLQHPSGDTIPDTPYFALSAPPPIDASSSPFGFSSSHDPKDIFGILQNEKVAVPTRSVRFTEPAIPIPDRSHGSQKQTMDPFEVRIRFTQHLQHLNASVTSANKAAQYALKYRDMDEDLHSCILEQLEKNSMNNRANIMYFIEHLCDMASRENHSDYVRMIERDIYQVVNAVAPEDGSGAANVKVVRKVLLALQEKSFLQAQTVSELDEYLKERDNTLPDTLNMSSPFDNDVEMGDTSLTPKISKGNANGGYFPKFDKKQAEQRIEEDRERHKRLRETIWAVPNVGGFVPGRTVQQIADEDVEFDKLVEETSELGEDDEDLYAEEMDDRNAAAEDWKEEFRARGVAGVE